MNASDFPLPQDVAGPCRRKRAQANHGSACRDRPRGFADESALRPITGALAAIARAARETSGYEGEVNASLLLIVDQFDEFFGGGLTADVRTGFARLLGLLARNAHVWIIVTLRADLYDQFLAQPD